VNRSDSTPFLGLFSFFFSLRLLFERRKEERFKEEEKPYPFKGLCEEVTLWKEKRSVSCSI